ncbi:MAG: ThiF family adenylyltransferase [Magnetococcus sp. YQC-5]
MSTIDSLWAERYSRQILLKEIGGTGQHRLTNASIGIVGAGTVGMTTLLYLAAAGVGRITIADAALITKPGIHPMTEAKTPKVHCAANRARELNPTLQIEAVCLHLTSSTLPSWLTPLDLILDCSHSPNLLNPACLQLQKPLLTTWLSQDGRGWIAGTNAGQDPSLPCLACLPMPTAHHANAAELFTLWRGASGSILASLALKTLLAIGTEEIWTTCLAYDPITGGYQRFPLEKNPHCQTCPPQQPPPPMEQEEDFIDITTETCPMTFVLVKLKLESMAPGQRLRVRLNEGEPLTNVPRTLHDEGYTSGAPWYEKGAFEFIVTKPEVRK